MPSLNSRATAVLACGLLMLGPVGAPAATEGTDEEVVLTGVLSRVEIEAALPDWVEELVLARPDPEAGAELAVALDGAEVEIFMGTWCSDSRRELARLWRALDDAGSFEPAEVSYVGVDRSMREPADRIGERELRFVPTIFVGRNGKELGRIVETSPDGIERDLLDLLVGRKRGLVTGRTDMAPGELDARGEPDPGGPAPYDPQNRR